MRCGGSSSLRRCLVVSVFLALLATGRIPPSTRADAGIALDGLREPAYGMPIATDPPGDLASPGPRDWVGTQWADLTALYVTHDAQYLYVYADLPAYQKSTSSGQIGLLIDVGGTPQGGTQDPWGNAIAFAHPWKPDFVVRGNIPGASPSDNGWTELLRWDGSAWQGYGVNWGGIPPGGQTGTRIAYADGRGVEFRIPLSEIGASLGMTLHLQLFTTQGGSTKGAYDTVPPDSQSTGWDASTTLSQWITYTLGAVPDCDVWWAEVRHDTFDPAYRQPRGTIPAGTPIRLRLRTAHNDLTRVRLRVWDDRTDTETFYTMGLEAQGTVYDTWTVTLPVTATAQPTILYYVFELTDDGGGACPFNRTPDTDWYADDDPQFYGGGTGQMYDDFNQVVWKSFQITVYDPAFAVPEWLQRAVVYQIFPDRFRDGDPSNDPLPGRFYYNRPGGTLFRSGSSAWNTRICDPRDSAGPCPDAYGENFYGGDLRGILQKIREGYFDALGVTVLYLNPIFRSPSNHKYDTVDYFHIDPDFGTLEDFQALVQEAAAHGIRIILDGVFNHVSSDSPYFDRYSRYDAAGNLTSPNGPGLDDNSGACESPASPYRAWFFFPDIGHPPMSAGDRCDANDADDPAGPWTMTYETWQGYGSLPKLNTAHPSVRALFYTQGTASVGPYWIQQGASGWRLDVAGDVDPGLTISPTNGFWSGFRAAIRSVRPDAVMIGEEWGDASPWLLGSQWDSAMNYRFRSAVLGWLATGCAGNGCSGGTVFQDNDDNPGSVSGPIAPLTPSQFHARLMSIWEDYPPPAWKAMLNLLGSHDTNRLRFLLRKVNGDDDAKARHRMQEAWLFAFTYAGAPTLYYGDEVGLSQDGVWDGSTWQDDPYNRAPYPWPDTPGDFQADLSLWAFVQRMASIRHAVRALQDGDVLHGLIIDDANRLYGFARIWGSQAVVVLLNRDTVTHTITLSGVDTSPIGWTNGTVLQEVLSGVTIPVSNGQVTIPVPPEWGAVVLQPEQADTPAAPTVLADPQSDGVALRWRPIRQDTQGGAEVVTRYEVFQSPSVEGPWTSVGMTSTAPFGEPDGYLHFFIPHVSWSSFFKVRAYNALGRYGESAPVQLAADVGVGLGAEPVPAVAGGVVTVTLAITNGGPSQAAGVVVSVTLPAALTPQVLPGDCGGTNPVVCGVGDLAAGATRTYGLRLGVDPVATGSVAVTATVGAQTPDPGLGNNTAVLGIPLTTAADVGVAQTLTAQWVGNGWRITQTITWTQAGPSRAASAVLTDTFPIEVTLEGDPPAGCTRQGSALRCTQSPMAPGATRILSIRFFRPATPIFLGIWRVEGGASEPDPEPSNNISEASLMLRRYMLFLPFIARFSTP